MAGYNRSILPGVIVVVALALAAAACGATSSEPTSVPRPGPTPAAPAVAPSPTLAAPPAPAATPEPTSTVAPTPVPATPTAEPATPVPATPTAEPTTPAAALFPYAVIDSNGNEVIFEGPAQRIIAMDSAVVETLFAIGQGHRVAGTHDFASYPPETADIAKVGDAFNMNIEATIALEPDLVFIFSDTFLPDLEKVGLKVLYLKSLSDDFRKVADNIRMWGRITGSRDAAEAVAAGFEGRVARIEETMATRSEGPTVFQDEGDLWTPGPDTLIGEVFRLLKLQNIAHDISGYAQLSPEVIVDRDPQLVIASYGDNISGNPAFQDLAAVKGGRIYIPSSDALSVAGPRYIDGIEELARWAYPELFE